MSDLRRWSDEGATAEERTMLEASRLEGPDPLLRERLLRALATDGTPAPDAARARSAGAGSATKIVGIAILGLALGAGVWRSMHPPLATLPRGAVAVPPSATIEAIPPAVAIDSIPVTAAPSPSASASSEPSDRSLPKRASKPAGAEASESSLAQEVAALERAQKVLATDPARAIALLDRYRVRFPSGKLWDEETVIRVQALLAAGKKDEALAMADSFVRSHPENPYARRAQDMVRGDKK